MNLKLIIFGILSLSFLSMAPVAESQSNIEAHGIISGTIREAPSGNPLSGTVVLLTRPNDVCPLQRAITDENGSFLFHNLPVGRYRLDAHKSGYEKRIYGETQENPNGAEIILSPTEDREYVEMQLSRDSSAAGHAYDEKGTPVERGFVFLIPADGKGRSFVGRTDELGYYWLEGIPPGFYKMMVRQYSPADDVMIGTPWYYPGTLLENEAQALWLEQGKTAMVDIYFPKDTRPFWKARVLGTEGEGIGKAELTLLQINANKLSYQFACRTSRNGECEMRNLSPGDYWAFVHSIPPPYAGWINSEKRNAAAPLEKYAQPVRIPEKGNTVTEFRLQKGKRLTIRFYRENGVAVIESGLNLILTHSFAVLNNTFGFIHSNRDASAESFMIEGLISGLDYQIRLDHNDSSKRYSVVNVTWNGAALADGGILRLDEGEHQVLEVLLEESGAIAGVASSQAQIAFAEPVETSSNRRYSYTGKFHSPVEQGRFLLRGLPPGTYRIRTDRKEIQPATVTIAAGETKEISLK